MNVIIDTHILLWWLNGDERLKESARDVIANGSNNIFVSAASLWEIALKSSLGKLKIPHHI